MAGVKVVDEDDDVIMITDGGVIIRIPVSQIPIHSRYSTGVKCMRVTDDTSVVTLARAPKEVEDDTEEEDTQTPSSRRSRKHPLRNWKQKNKSIARRHPASFFHPPTNRRAAATAGDTALWRNG